MNIFAIEKTPDNKIDWIKSAQSQDNYRVVKMTLESCQLLCTGLNTLYGEKVSPYRTTHINHPSTLWVRESSDNFEALIEHTMALLDEYSDRFNKIHKCSKVLDTIVDLYDPNMFPQKEGTSLPLCMPDEFIEACPIESYRKFYASKPNIRYPKEKIPTWFVEYRKNIPFVTI
jgi:hypothetical protein